MTQENTLNSNIMLIRLEIGTPFSTKTNKVETANLLAEKGAQSGALSVKMPTFASPIVKAAKTACGLIQKEHKCYCSKWDDAGFWLIKTDRFDAYKGAMDRRIDDAQYEINKLADMWDIVVDEERQFKGASYREDMMCSREQFSEAFHASYKVQAMPNMEGIEINSFTMRELKSALQKRNEDNLKATTNALHDEMAEMLGKMVKTLGDPDKVFRNTLVENIRTLCEQRTARDMMDSPDLKAKFDSIKLMVDGYNVNDLRKNKHLRSEAGREAEELLERMTTAGSGRRVL